MLIGGVEKHQKNRFIHTSTHVLKHAHYMHTYIKVINKLKLYCYVLLRFLHKHVRCTN